MRSNISGVRVMLPSVLTGVSSDMPLVPLAKSLSMCWAIMNEWVQFALKALGTLRDRAEEGRSRNANEYK